MRNRSRIESFGLRQRSGAFTVCFPSWNDILFVCARTPAELVGAWQPPFQKIKCVSGLSSCVPVLLHAIVILIALFFLFKEFSCSLSLFSSCILCFSRSVMVDWQKYSFGHNARRSREQICVFYDALLHVLAIGAVFTTRGTRVVSRQHLWQLSGVASESLCDSHDKQLVTMGVCFVVFRTKWVRTLFLFFFVCSLDRTVLLSFSPVWNQQCLLACGQMRTRRIFLYTRVCVTRGTPTHTANTHHVGDVVVSFFSLIDHWVSADRSVNRRRRGSRSLRRPRSPNSWRHDNNTLRYHCALCGPAAIMASRRFWDSSSNVV